MILFPNAKINLGLNVLRKRTDGYHDIETLFHPIQLSDILEINLSNEFDFKQTGIEISGDIDNNLVVKAFRLMQAEFNLPNVAIHLHKIVPFGAGLGGGSSDAAYTLNGINELFELKLTLAELSERASKLGSDCPFFIYNQPMLGEGRGEILSHLSSFSLKGYYLVLIKPEVMVSTAGAYAGITPIVPPVSVKEIVKGEVSTWKNVLKNQFELSVFNQYPEIEAIKLKLYQLGATYASMSGSGSSVFGIFETEPRDFSQNFPNCFFWKESCL